MLYYFMHIYIFVHIYIYICTEREREREREIQRYKDTKRENPHKITYTQLLIHTKARVRCKYYAYDILTYINILYSVNVCMPVNFCGHEGTKDIFSKYNVMRLIV